MKQVLSILALVSLCSQGARVIDLGSKQIQGQFRGPQLQLITSSEISKKTASHIFYTSLKQLESKLLTPESQRPRKRPAK